VIGGRGREARALRRRCQRIVEGLQLPEPFDLESLCETIGRHRGRPLRVEMRGSAAGTGSPCGMWVALETEDVFLIDQRSSSYHRQHIGLHEVGHVLAGHNAGPGLDHDLAIRLLPRLDPSMAKMVLGRDSYGTPQEQEAETIALLLSERIAAPRRVLGAARGADQADADALMRLYGAFGGKDR
jgi:hypothetical protein